MLSLTTIFCASTSVNTTAQHNSRTSKRRLSAKRLTLLCTALILAFVVPTAFAGEPPVAMDDYGHCNINSSVEIDILYNDYGIEHYVLDPSSVHIVVAPNHGGVVIDFTWGYTTYTADTDYEGTDQFRYTVDDMYGNTSNAAYVDIDVCDDYYSW